MANSGLNGASDGALQGSGAGRSGAGSRSRSARDEGELEELRRAVERSYRLGLIIWPSFFLLDLWVVYVIAPGTPLWPFLVARASVLVGAVASFRLLRHTAYPAALAEVAFYGTASTGIALMALFHHGLASPYLHGTSLVLLVHAAVITSQWRRAIVSGLLLAIPYPIVMGIAALWDAGVRAQWTDVGVLEGFVENYLFVLATAIISAFASHAVWSAQRQVYEARRLGRYRLKVRIGSGGMGDVWMASDEVRKIDVAVKILSASASHAAGAVARFEREAKIAASLRSRHTVRVFDYGASDDGVRYLAMELLSGANLGQIVTAEGPLPIARAVHFARQACESLDEAHRAGIVHRDIKPENLFVTSDGGVGDVLKLLDFGIAKIAAAEESDATLTQAGWIGGTPAYMPPEVCAGAPAEPRSDLYSLGAVLYFLLTGVPPFTGETAMAVMTAHTREVVRPPSELRRDPACVALDTIVLRCLAKRPADRFESAAALRAALAGACGPWTQTSAGDTARVA